MTTPKLSVALLSVLITVAGLCAAGAQRPVPATPAGIKIGTNVLVPMRDGVSSRPTSTVRQEGRFPVLLCRTPYNKNGQRALAKFFVEQGYAVVVMDSRGLYASNGEWHPYTDEARDGYDTQQWVGQQPWSNGKVGMFGPSYPGYTQVAPAPFRSPYVKAIMPEAAQSSNFERDLVDQRHLSPRARLELGHRAGSDRHRNSRGRRRRGSR